MDNRDKIKNRIKALLSKTIENGATKQEMESALTKANQLMAEFFISEHDLQDIEIIKKCVSESFNLTKSGYDLTLFYADLARLFDCEYFYNSKTITFFGHEQDVALCGYFYNVISKTCLYEKDKYLKSDKYKRLKNYYHGRTLSSSFIKGFLIEVVSKMKDLYKDREANIPKEYGLMVVKKKEKVTKEFEELNLNIRVIKSKQLIGERESYNDGKQKGSEVNLVQGIESCENANPNVIVPRIA